MELRPLKTLTNQTNKLFAIVGHLAIQWMTYCYTATDGGAQSSDKNILCIFTVSNLQTSFQHIFGQTMNMTRVYKHYTGVHQALNMLTIS
jgi:hypothetical protein